MKAKTLLFTCLMAAFALLSCDKKADAVEFSYKEPVLSWGASPATIKAQETRTIILVDDNETLAYADQGNFVQFCIYFFDDSGHLKSAVIHLKNNNAETLNQAKEFIGLRYPYVGVNGSNTIYGNTTTIVSITTSDLGLSIIYTPPVP